MRRSKRCSSNDAGELVDIVDKYSGLHLKMCAECNGIAVTHENYDSYSYYCADCDSEVHVLGYNCECRLCGEAFHELESDCFCTSCASFVHERN